MAIVPQMPYADYQKQLAKSREYAASHKEQARENGRRHAASHREELRERSRLYRQANREACLERAKRWRQAHPERHAASEAKRRTRKRGAAIGDQEQIALFYEHVRVSRRLRCYWCKAWTKSRDRHVDHIVPLSRGGVHAAVNLCCACSKCNLSKSNKMPEEFAGQFQMEFCGSALTSPGNLPIE